jgi:hypothetical protein
MAPIPKVPVVHIQPPPMKPPARPSITPHRPR